MGRVLDPDLLRTFVRVAEGGSFAAAARCVHRTPSAVSMQMKRLKELLGRDLFAHTGRGIELTRDGELLLGHAHRVLRAHDETLAAFDNGALAGTVTVGAPDDCASTFLPDILSRFATTHPLVHVDVVCAPSQGLLTRLADATIDLALITKGSGESGGIVAQHREPLVWVGAVDRDTHKRDPLPLALFGAECAFRKATLAALDERGRAYRAAYTSVSLAGIKAAIGAGLAVGVIARCNVDRGLRILGEADGMPSLPSATILLVRTQAHMPPMVDRLAEHVVASLHAGLLSPRERSRSASVVLLNKPG
jgi:DNA-binding transcriptional LysR family regulator